MSAYYNEIDPFAAQWLRNLISRNLIAPGDVDERSIIEVQPDDLRGYDQCHFFAGIGGWSYALRLAGWPDDRPVWTGSCPCQPFSAAGKQRGSDDERHLWPAFFDLIRECRPATVFGEQVAGASGLAWLDHVLADLEGDSYTAAAAVVPACGVGAPHIRQRLWFVAHSTSERLEEQELQLRLRSEQLSPRAISRSLVAHANSAQTIATTAGRLHSNAGSGGPDDWVAHAECSGSYARRHNAGESPQSEFEHRCALGDSSCTGPQEQRRGWIEPTRLATASVLDAWADLEWLQCSDGKARPTQPGLFPLAHGIPHRVGRLRAYGNAIVPQVAAEVIKAYMERSP